MPLANQPRLIFHCDWGANPKKHWMAIARWDHVNERYIAEPTQQVGDTSLFLLRLRHSVGKDDRVLCGFDFPIGFPKAYAAEIRVDNFVDVLPHLGFGKWENFYDKCRLKKEIKLERPFYPVSCQTKGAATRNHLYSKLKLKKQELLRICERKTEYRGDASPLFWTLGAKAVGTAAITGWRDLIAPAVRCDASVGLWPFDGMLKPLLKKKKTVFAETYPGDAYSHLNFPKNWRGKTKQETRLTRSKELMAWVNLKRAQCKPKLIGEIKNGFGDGKDGEDRFDAAVGLFSMIDVVLGHRSEGVPNDNVVKNIEGWIFGQQSQFGVSK